MTLSVPLQRPLLSDLAFVRLWCAGALFNGSMWLETLAAALFTYEATGSSWLVAVVSAARAAPLLIFGLGVGVAADAWNRHTIVVIGLVLSAASSAAIVLLSASTVVQPWHLAVAALVSGSAYCTEFPARRRVIAESAGPSRIDAAVALDNLTGSGARCLGPALGGLAFDHFGLGGSFAISAAGNVVGALLMASTYRSQAIRHLDLRAWQSDLRTAAAFVRRSRPMLGLLAVTVTMNLFGFSYATLVTPVGVSALGLGGTATGLLAAAEPAGAFAAGLILTRLLPPGSRLSALMGGVALLSAGLLATAGLGAAGLPVPLLCLALAVGGIGSAVYSNAQTSLVMAETPPELRSRVMGLMTVCIGSWPVGMLVAGLLARTLPPLGALATLPVFALVSLGAIVALQGMARRNLG